MRGDLTNRLLLKLLSVCNHCTVFFRTFLPLAKNQAALTRMGSFQPGAVVADLLRSRFASRSNEMTFLMLQIGRLQEVADHHGGEV